ncbi:MAG: inositol monophosphatase [Rickettsiales bacterium]|jgi:myo-inositol-1(or 4)-monophosphatase|nr:inositol monophosphatase [Rickettsiales bacterium]
MENLSANLNVMAAACKTAARFMLRDFGEIEQLQSSIHGSEGFASASRIKTEKALADALLDARPKFGLLSRSGETKGTDISHRFIINAVDGFSNFARGVPFFAVSVALQQQKNLVAAVVHNPVLDKMFWAEKGTGAFVSETRMTRRIRVSRRTDPAIAAINVSGGSAGEIAALAGSGAKAVTLGSDGLALAYLAAGMIDGYAGFSRDVFDLAAGIVLVKEAGGKIAAFDDEGRATERAFGAKTVIFENNYLQPDLTSIIIGKKSNQGLK